jgi:hypothetical protein
MKNIVNIVRPNKMHPGHSTLEWSPKTAMKLILSVSTMGTANMMPTSASPVINPAVTHNVRMMRIIDGDYIKPAKSSPFLSFLSCVCPAIFRCVIANRAVAIISPPNTTGPDNSNGKYLQKEIFNVQ